MRPMLITLTILPLAVLAMAAHSSKASFTGQEADAASGAIKTISPQGHQAIKAEILDPSPSNLTIDVKKMANLNVNEEAPTFAVYTTSSLPDTCGDFNHLELDYQKPDKYTRVFDVSEHPEVISAIDKYGCVVMKNIPPKG